MNAIKKTKGKFRLTINLPYGLGIQSLDTGLESVELLEGSVENLNPLTSGNALVNAAMEHPIDSPTLRELAADKKKAVIIISDHTRPVPSQIILPPMLKELREGNPNISVTLLVATGFHRGSTIDELRQKLGDELYGRETIVVHDCADPSANVDIGKLPSGARLVIDRLAAEADLLISEGFIEPHFFAGFSGGRKSVLPGICARETVLGNHCSKFINSPYARTGILSQNPIHQDMIAAVKMARLQYIVNVIIDHNRDVRAAFAGNPITAHEEGCRILEQYCRVSPQNRADIVITTNGGAPLDQNIYQSVKGLTAAEAAAAPGGVLIICAECRDGTGGDGFYTAMKQCASPEQLLQEISAIPQEQTKPDQWEYQILARILSKHPVIFVTQPKLKHTIEDMKMIYSPNVQTAWELAKTMRPGGTASVIRDGISVIVH